MLWGQLKKVKFYKKRGIFTHDTQQCNLERAFAPVTETTTDPILMICMLNSIILKYKLDHVMAQAHGNIRLEDVIDMNKM